MTNTPGKIRSILPLLLLCMVLLLSNCIVEKEHSYYLQNPHVVSLFKEKNEFTGTGFMLVSKNNEAKGFNAAYSVTDKFAVALGYMQFNNSQEEFINKVSTGKWSGTYYDMAFGRYKDLKKFGVFEIYGGLSYGAQQHQYSTIKEEWVTALFVPVVSQTATPVGDAVIESCKVYVQPNYGFSFDGLDVALSARISYINLVSVQNGIKKNTSPYNEVKYMSNNPNSFFFEPAVTFRAGWKYVKFQVQLAYAAGADIKMDQTTVNFGLQLALANRLSRKEIKE